MTFCGNCRNARELHCSYMHWHVPFIGDLGEMCISGLVVGNCKVSLLKGNCGNAEMAGCPDVAW